MKEVKGQCFDCYSDSSFRYHGQTGTINETKVQQDYVAGLEKPVTVVDCVSCGRKLEYAEKDGKWHTSPIINLKLSKYKDGDKIVPISKKSRSREFDTCASHYMRVELNQEFLYVNGIDEEATKQLGETCYWCHALKDGKGDSYRESDLIPYAE